jgi:ribosomal protein L7Ae-like RNA K-turn-binding protein
LLFIWFFFLSEDPKAKVVPAIELVLNTNIIQTPENAIKRLLKIALLFGKLYWGLREVTKAIDRGEALLVISVKPFNKEPWKLLEVLSILRVVEFVIGRKKREFN